VHTTWGSDVEAIKNAIRARRPHTPLVMLKGHSHVLRIEPCTDVTADPTLIIESGPLGLGWERRRSCTSRMNASPCPAQGDCDVMLVIRPD